MGKKDIEVKSGKFGPASSQGKIVVLVFSAIIVLALFVLLIDYNAPSVADIGEVASISFAGANTLSYPTAPEDTYCARWTEAHTDYTKTVWFDRPSAYSARMICDSMGWTQVKSPSKAATREFSSRRHDYDDIEEGVVESKPDNLETDRGLYFVPLEADWIFTRMYHYRDGQMRNEQTARLGIDYGCPG